VPALQLSAPAVLSLYAVGHTTGLVLDAGEGVTCVVPVVEGCVVGRGVQRLHLAGCDVTDALRLHLRRTAHLGPPTAGAGRGAGATAADAGSGGSGSGSYVGALGPSLHTGSEVELVRMLKEATCGVAPEPLGAAAAAGRATAAPPPADFTLPDGQVVRLSGADRLVAGEVLFAPAAAGIDALGLQEAAAEAVRACELELRPALLGEIQLAGGTACMPGVGQRLLWEMRRLASPAARIRVHAPAGRRHSAWVGGSVFASLGTFAGECITRAEWEEEGERCVARRRATVWGGI
jgi:actin-related protein